LPDVRVDALQSWRRSTTDAQGNAYLTRLTPDRRTDIVLDPTTVDDIELRSGAEGVSIEPRAASWSQVDFPMVRTMELEGHVYSVPAPGAEPIGQSRAPVELLNADGEVVSRQRAAFDGFYLFSSVLPGSYQVRLSESVTDEVSQSPGPVSVTAAGGVIRNLDFVLEPWRSQQIQNRITPVPATESGEERPGFVPDERPSFAPVAPVAPATTTPVPTVEEVPLNDFPETFEQIEPQPEPAPQAAAPNPAGNWFVQLGAFGEADNAENFWRNLTSRGAMPDDYEPVYATAGGLTRLFVGPGRSESDTRALCRRLQSQGTDCLVKER
jgi:cell division septation protein DedD